MAKSIAFMGTPVPARTRTRIPLGLFRPPFRTQFPPSWMHLAFAFVLLASGNSLAQSGPPKGAGPENDGKPIGTFALHVDEVDLPFVVADRHHHWITDLSQKEIRLLDNGLPPESIRIFESRSGLPLRVGLALDTSDSISQQFTYEKDAAALFISRLVNPAKDLAFVLEFNDDPAMVQDLTSDTLALAAAVRKLELGGRTALYDAVHFACKRLLREKDEGFTRRVLVLITDGDDNNSQLPPALAIEEVLRHNVVVIVLDTDPAKSSDDPRHKILEKLATVTGGQVLRAGNKEQMTKAFEELSSRLRSYYLLAYRPAQFTRDGSYHKIHLKATRRGVHIICRSGYYAARDAGE
jgi:VWFA-related protein